MWPLMDLWDFCIGVDTVVHSHLSDSRINVITQKVISAAMDTLGNKLDKVILYGSYARGDYESDSDIDFLILADVAQEEVSKWDSDINKRLQGIDLEYDILVSVYVTGREIFNGYVDILPYYASINREGVVLYAA